MSNPLVSFVIPVYQKPPEVFARCLDSLHDMSLKEIEVICVFDGEDLPLQQIAAKYKKVQSVVIEHGGAPKARNKGLEMATGKYVVFWDADCIIKPETAKRWLEEFKAVPDADFVYTGYEIGGERATFDAEPFDAYSLTCGNYISSMSPILREKAPRWDEDLPAAQDWDYFWTAVDNGCKGAFIEGQGFVTETARTGMSSIHWSAENRDTTIQRIREKHGIKDREIAVYSLNYKDRALKLAKLLNADLLKQTGRDPDKYRLIFNLGYSHISRFEGIPENIVRVQYWVPGEIAGLAEARYSTVKETVRVARTVINLCNTQYEKNALAELGIEAEVLPLPVSPEDIQKVQTDLPEKFSVFVATDPAYGELMKDIGVDLPHIEFKFDNAKSADVSCVMSFYQFATLDEAIMSAQVNGRHVISNVQAPYCGFIDPNQTWEIFKKDLYERIRIVKGLPFNKEAQSYYLQLANPVKFKEKLLSYLSPKLEVIA